MTTESKKIRKLVKEMLLLELASKAPSPQGKKKKKPKQANAVGGDRIVSKPVTQSRVLGSHTPRMFTVGKNPVVYHRELVNTVVGSSAFALNGGFGGALLSLNPMNANLFPWLLPIATSFERYRFRRLRLTYVPVCGTNFVGRVGLFYDKDSQDNGPFTRQDFSSYTRSVDTPVWEGVSLDSPSDNTFRFLNDTSGVDRKLFDNGRFGWVTYACGNGDVDGDLYLEYEIELEAPQPSLGTVSTVVNPVGNALVLNSTGDGPTYINTYTFSGTTLASTFTYQLAPGTYKALFQITGTNFTSGEAAVTGNASLNGPQYTVTNGPNGNHTMLSFTVTVNDVTGLLIITEVTTSGATFSQHSLTLARTNVSVINAFT